MTKESFSILTQSLSEQAQAIATGQLNPLELLDAYADWITRSQSKINAFTSTDFEIARSALKAGNLHGPLAGIPLAIKDLIHVSGFKTTCASKMLEHYHAPFEATVIERLRQAGAVFYGKLNMDEFAMGSSNENSAFGNVANPWDLKRAPGGSSGGSAAAVAALQTPATLGSDTGGSIRQPAAFCGITGLKPTYGRVSRYGLAAFASSLDQIGPMARTAEDCALIFNIIAGLDPRDATCASTPIPTLAECRQAPPKRLRIGIPQEYMSAPGLNQEVQAAIDTLVDWCKTQGYEIKPISLPHTPYTTATYYLIATAEASSNLARYDGIRYTSRIENPTDLEELYCQTRGQYFGKEVKRRIMLGTFALSSGYYDAYYGKAQKARTKIREDFDHAFSEVDLILTPTSPTTAFKLGEKTADPLEMYLSDIYTNACNLAGIPGISFCCGFDRAQLPIGAQLMAPAFAEALLLQFVHQYQQTTHYHQQRPHWVQEELS